jgi:TctA family transporter
MKSIDENAPSRGSVSGVDVALAVSVMVPVEFSLPPIASFSTAASRCR